MNVFKFHNVSESYKALVENVVMKGNETMPRELLARELDDVILEYVPPFSYTFMNEKRRINPVFHLVELFYFLNGRSDSILTEYISNMKEFQDDSGRFPGSYGPPIYETLPFVIQELSKKDSRRAVIPILRSSQLTSGSKDIPCNVLLAFRVRQRRLTMEVFTRSQDLFLGFLYDTLEFQLLQTMLCKLLEVNLGTYVHHIVSLHLYNKDMDAALQSIASPTSVSEHVPVFPTMDTPPDFWRYVSRVNAVIDGLARESDDITRAIANWRLRENTPLTGVYSDWVNWWLNTRKNSG